ncbi:hypothetical protein Q7P36_000888 [Cladosporium allicinum]
MQLSNHGELIAVMTELWTLLDTLAVVEPGALRLPPPDTGYHPTSAFHADAALAAGFHPEAAAVMSALPYIHTEDWDPFELEGSTFPMSYLHSDEGGFAISREMFSDDNIMPPSALRLTWQDVNGWDCIYDTEKSQSTLSIFPTQMCLPHTANVAASNRARVYLEQHQRPLPGLPALTPVAAPEITFVETDQNSGPTQPESGTSAQHEAEFNLWKAMCGLADLYLECGWDVNAVAQTDFRRVEFVEKRTKYLSEIIGPLEESVLEAGRHARQQQNLLNFADRGELDAVCILAGTDHAPLQAY